MVAECQPDQGLRLVQDEPADQAELPDGQQLADVLSEFAGTMLTDFPIQAILDHLVDRIVDILPISSAGVTLIEPGANPRYIAATNREALRYEQVQSKLDEGPCMLAFHSGEPVSVPDLRADDRFPHFGPEAVSAGLAAVFTFPLRHGKNRLGALDLYRQEPGPLLPKAMAAAKTLADVVTAYLMNARAREALQASSEQSRDAALHDPLTGLPNRVLMMERMEHAFQRSRRSGKATAVLFMNLDRFKAVNDRFGHRVGDDLLIGVAQRLSSLLRPADTLARLAGDEFVVICEDLDHAEDADTVAGRLAEGLSAPFRLSGTEISITASIGIAYADQQEQSVQYSSKQLVHEADMAMYRAKRDGGHRRVFQPRYARLAGLEQDLAGADGRGELVVDYQPIVATSDQRVHGFEALLRWHHPQRGVIAPSVFIPLAEKTGLIDSIGAWVLQRAWADRLVLQRYNSEPLRMAVNVSAHQLTSRGFVDTVADVLAGSRDPHLLNLRSPSRC